jgi:drug/metabolite transporter (DMT)-like permease
VNALRYSGAFALLTAQTWLPSQRSLPRTPSGGWGPVIPAFIADALLGSSLYVYGLSHSDLAVGATLSALAPLISVPVAIVVGEESWSASRLAAVVATVGGVVLLVATGR